MIRFEKDKYGTCIWYKDGQLHRNDGPAITFSNGTVMWYKDGKLHREDGPAIYFPLGVEMWYMHGLLHREDGPAIKTNDGLSKWYINGQLHRDDGPAVEYPDGSCEWWVNGVRQENKSEDNFNKSIELNNTIESLLAERKEMLEVLQRIKDSKIFLGAIIQEMVDNVMKKQR
jgi:hypothetical protein